MKHPMNYRLALLFGLIATGIEASDAAEWTSTIDRHATFTNTTFIGGELATTDEALWIGPNRAFDPTTGADLSPYALPERMSLVDDQYGISSQRGQLWKTYWFFDFMPYYRPDAVEGFWGQAGTFPTEALYLTKDGARMRRWKAADFGHPEMHVIDVNPLLEDAGAMVLIGNDSAALALQVDGRGNVVRSTSVPACSTNVSDDRHGDLYLFCPAAGISPGELHHFGTSEADRWSRRADEAMLTRSGIGADGGVLIYGQVTSGDRFWQSLDRQGRTRLLVSASKGVAHDQGFWFLDRSKTQLTHYGLDGRTIATFSAQAIQNFKAHADGTVIALGQFDTQDAYNEYGVVSETGSMLRILKDRQQALQTRSQISIWQNSTIPVMTVRPVDGEYYHVLIDDHGEPSSAAFNNQFMLNGPLMSDASTICTSGMVPVIPGILATDCFDRQTGQRLLGLLETSGTQILNVDGNIVLVSRDAFEWRTRNNALIQGISREGEIAWNFHPTQGLALLRVSDGNKRLQRYRSDGSLIFDVAAPFVAGESVVAVGSDGSTIVAGKSSPTSLLRYDAEGNLRAIRTLDLSQPGTPLVAASSSSNGVLLLQRRSDDRDAYSGQVTMLDAQLVRRGDYAFAGALDAQLQPARDGAARFVHTSPSGMMVLQFDPASGQPSERRALPVQNIDGRFAIDLDGVVRAMSFDAALGRDVLRISRPEPSRFTGPIRQSALAGAWFNPASTGQGLLLQLLNGDVLFGAWHTFAPEGGNALSKQQWFTVTGKVTNERGRITMPIYRNAQGRFDTDGVTPAEVVGSAELVFTGCDQMEFWYRIGDDAGAFPLQRLTPRTQACDDGTTTQPAADAPKGLAIDGAWLDPAQSGQGFTFNTTGARFGSFLAGWFTYDTDNGVDDDDAQHWFTLQGATPERYGQSVLVSIHRTTGGSRAGTPTLNSHQVGSALLTIDDCAHATLDYAFDDSAVAGPFADRARRVQLSRLGACPQ